MDDATKARFALRRISVQPGRQPPKPAMGDMRKRPRAGQLLPLQARHRVRCGPPMTRLALHSDPWPLILRGSHRGVQDGDTRMTTADQHVGAQKPARYRGLVPSSPAGLLVLPR